MDEIFDCLIISNQIYLADLTGKITAQLTSVNDGFNGLFPFASSDGKFIFYTSSASGSFELWRMNSSDGSDKIKVVMNFSYAKIVESRQLLGMGRIENKIRIF